MLPGGTVPARCLPGITWGCGLHQVMADGDFVNSVISGLPGVNPDDAMVRGAIANLQNKPDGEKDETKDGKDDGKKDG